MIIWTTYGITRNHVYPFPSFADLGFIGYSLPAAAGLLLFPRASQHHSSRPRTALDAVVIALGILFISWATVLGSVYEAGGAGWLARLTGLNNRLKLNEDLDRLHHRSVRYGRNYSVALCDIDFFKSYNDVYGHQAGDRALQAVAAALAEFGREGEGIYRYGGEEFLLILPEQTTVTAAVALERFRESVQLLGIPNSAAPAGVLTVSVGISSFLPGCGQDSEGLLRDADIALYEAKAQGRNMLNLAAAPARTRPPNTRSAHL